MRKIYFLHLGSTDYRLFVKLNFENQMTVVNVLSITRNT
jgi:hypothetical protein